MSNNSKLTITLTAFFILVLFTKKAYAYLDPGTGSMMIQALLAVVAAVSVSIGMFWRRLRSFFSHFFSKKD